MGQSDSMAQTSAAQALSPIQAVKNFPDGKIGLTAGNEFAQQLKQTLFAADLIFAGDTLSINQVCDIHNVEAMWKTKELGINADFVTAVFIGQFFLMFLDLAVNLIVHGIDGSVHILVHSIGEQIVPSHMNGRFGFMA
jgi:hypothetical protein